MRYALKLEAVGDNARAVASEACRAMNKLMPGSGGNVKGMSPWVARIWGRDPKYTFTREFMQGQKDYSEANSVGSRGVYLHYWLEPGVYEVNEFTSWSSSRRYFLQVLMDGSSQEISREELLKVLQ